MGSYGRTLASAVLAAAVLGAAPLGCDDDQPTSAPPPEPPVLAAPTICGEAGADVEADIEALLDGMTLEEKVAQMHGLQVNAIDDLYHAGGNPRLEVPPFRMVDGPRGVRAGNATAFPVAASRGASWNPELERRVGEAIGAETRGKGGNVILAPTINVLRHPRWGRAQETYGEDPFHMGTMGVAFIEGAQTHVVATAKHFAANSIEDTRFSVDVQADERVLREVYLPHFRRAVHQGRVGAIMSAYNQLNGFYCSANVHLLREILKDEWDFRGLVMSDWILGVYETVGAALAGLDVEMPLGQYYGAHLVAAVMDGEVPEDLIDDAVRRILRVKGCFDVDAPNDAFTARVESPAHQALALEAARQGSVLLKNEADALPLHRDRLSTLVVVGPLAQVANIGDLGSSAVVPSRTVNPLEGIRAAAGALTVTYIEGAEALTEAEQATIGGADAVVVVTGLAAEDEGEGGIAAGDRVGLALPEEKNALVSAVAALSHRTIVVLEGGSAMIVEPWIDDVEAVLLAWYPGQEGGTAIAELLFGDANPSGKLPVSFPREVADLPEFDNMSGQVTYGPLHGYTHLTRAGKTARFPFGHGLSYTVFEYGAATATNVSLVSVCADCDDPAQPAVTVSIEVANGTAIDGAEVVQVYLQRPNPDPEWPLWTLRAFQRISLPPGASQTVSVGITGRGLARYDVDAGTWVVDPGTYTVRVGASSEDIRSVASFVVAGP